MRYMKSFFSLLLAIISIFYILNILAESSTKTQNLDQVIAVVNNSVITQSDVDIAFMRAKQQMAAMPEHQHISDLQLKKLLLQQLIDRKLQLMIAQQARIKVTQAQVMKAIQNIAKTNHLTVNQLKTHIKQSGSSFEDYQKAIHDELLIHQVQESAIGNKVQITDQDVQHFLSQYKAQWSNAKYHVMDVHIPVADIDSKIAVEQAKQIALRSQQQWKKTGKINSNNVTDLGWQTADTLPALFLDQLMQMKPGDISSPILAPNGFHLIKLIEVQQSSSSSPNQDQIKNMVYQMKFQTEVQKWLQELRKTAYIKIYNAP